MAGCDAMRGGAAGEWQVRRVRGRRSRAPNERQGTSCCFPQPSPLPLCWGQRRLLWAGGGTASSG